MVSVLFGAIDSCLSKATESLEHVPSRVDYTSKLIQAAVTKYRGGDLSRIEHLSSAGGFYLLSDTFTSPDANITIKV